MMYGKKLIFNCINISLHNIHFAKMRDITFYFITIILHF